jgi:hypothetical protein
VSTWRSYLARLVPQWLGKYWGERLVGANGLMADIVSEGASEALRASWLRESTSPDDVLPLVAQERMLERYPSETAATHRERLINAWFTWEGAGHETSIEGQFAAAGFPGVVVYSHREIDRGPSTPWQPDVDHYTRFWVFFPESSNHGVTGDGPAYGSFSYGDGSLYGISGITEEQAALIRRVIGKFKPFKYICVEIIFEITGLTCGVTPLLCGDPEAICGGTQAIMAPR